MLKKSVSFMLMMLITAAGLFANGAQETVSSESAVVPLVVMSRL